MRLLLVIAAVVSCLARAHEEERPFELGTTAFKGSGCEDGRVLVRVGDKGDGAWRLTVEWPDAGAPFRAAAGPDGRRQRVACNGIIPLRIQPDKRVGLAQRRIAGRVSVPPSNDAESVAHAELTSEFFFVGDRGQGPRAKRRFDGPTEDEAFALTTNESSSSSSSSTMTTVWSACGRSDSFRINTALMATGAGSAISISHSPASGSDVGDGHEFELLVQDCEEHQEWSLPG